MLNYESELNEALLEQLSIMYKVKRPNVYHYFYLRFLIEHQEKEIHAFNRNRMIVEFLLRELNIPLVDKKVVYKGEAIEKGCTIENSLENIVVDWEFSASLKDVMTSKGISMTHEEFIKREWKRIQRHGKNKAKPYKQSPLYLSYLKWHSLEFLNKLYQASPTAPHLIEGIDYPLFHNLFVRTLEEVYIADIHSVEWATTNVVSITEKELEKYLINNLSIIEASRV